MGGIFQIAGPHERVEAIRWDQKWLPAGDSEEEVVLRAQTEQLMMTLTHEIRWKTRISCVIPTC